MRAGGLAALRSLRPAAMPDLPMSLQHAAEAGLAGNVGPFIRQQWHDPRRRQLGKAGFVGDLYDLLTFRGAERVCRGWPCSTGTAVAAVQPLMLPALKRAGIDAGYLTGGTESRSLATSLLDPPCASLAIFQRGHSSSSRCKIASSFFDSTNNAVVSASALSLRRRSRSSSLMRLRESRLSFG